MTVEVEVEYCESCGSLKTYQELTKIIRERNPDVRLKGQNGRRGSFEVTINGQLVHSRLNTLTLPDFDDLSMIIKEVGSGKDIRPCKQHSDCTII